MELRPVLRCFIAREIAPGQFGRSKLVSLGTAFLAKRAGFVVVGPDPADEHALARYERERQPFNPPHP